jgi:hypothetical protein
MDELKKYYDIVETGIEMAQVKPEHCRSKTEGQWNLKRINTDIWIDLWHMEDEGKTYFQVMTPLVEIPQEKKEEFFHELLDLNYQLVGGGFVTYKNGVYLKATQDAETITPDTVFILLNRIGHYGNLFEEGLLKRYNTKKLEHHD